MRLLRDALADLVLLCSLHPNLGHLGALYLLENRFGQIRSVQADNEYDKVTKAFSFNRTDNDVMIHLAGTANNSQPRSQSYSSQSAGSQMAGGRPRAALYPYPTHFQGHPRQQYPRQSRGPRGQSQNRSRRFGAANQVPKGLETCAQICYEWILHGEHKVTDADPCPSRAGPDCEWQHRWPRRADDEVIEEYRAWVTTSKAHLKP